MTVSALARRARAQASNSRTSARSWSTTHDFMAHTVAESRATTANPAIERGG